VIVETITRGRTNQMPAHRDLLGEARIHLLTAYVLSLSQSPR
jgi:cytochrome c oxidase cbb3-type subunit 3